MQIVIDVCHALGVIGVASLASAVTCLILIVSYEHAGRLIPPQFYADQAMISQEAEHAANALFRRDWPGFDEMSEYERHELKVQCERHIERAILHYAEAVRRRIEAAGTNAPKKPSAS